MSHPLFFICPNCLSEDSIRKNKCEVCNIPININKDQISFSKKILDSETYFQKILTKIKVEQSSGQIQERMKFISVKSDPFPLRISGSAILRQSTRSLRFTGYHQLFSAIIDKPQPIDRGVLVLYPDYVVFKGEKKEYRWSIEAFTCVTTNSLYLEFKVKEQPFYQIKFLRESPLKYEIILRKWLDDYYESHGKTIIEYQPHVRLSEPRLPGLYWNIESEVPERETEFKLETLFFKFLKLLFKTFFRLFISVEIQNRSLWNLTESMVICNHQCILDPFIIGVFLDGKIAYLTKSTNFCRIIPRTFLKWARAIPTTRYKIDPVVIRNVRKMLYKGMKIGIFPEGELTWSGDMNPFKLGTIKLILTSRQAIQPIIIKNAYHFWPRWTKFPRRAKVILDVQAPFCLLPGVASLTDYRQFLEDYFEHRFRTTAVQENMAIEQ